MPILDDIGKKVGEFAANTKRRSKEISDTSKLKSAIRQEEARIDDTYMAIGRAYFETKRATASGTMKELCKQIEDAQQSIEEKQQQILSIKGLANCPKCGKEVNARTTRFCPDCGGAIPDLPDDNDDEDGLPRCPNCNEAVSASTVFCPKCGHKLD